MRNSVLLDRPAQTAIAAALALASTPIWAQETAPVNPASDAIVAPQTEAPQSTAPALPPIAMPLPEPQSEPRTTPDAVAAVPLPEVEAPAQAAARTETPRQASTRPAPVARGESAPAPNRSAPARKPEAPLAATPATTSPAAPQPGATPALTPSDLVAMQRRQDEAQATSGPEAAAPQQDDSLYWIMGAGGAVVVLGLGAFALRRRGRKSPVASHADDALPTAPVASPVAPARQERRAADLSATHAPMRIGDERSDLIEAMVAQAPSAENPFLTRRERLRRANFLLDNAGLAPVSAAPDPAPAEDVPAAVTATPSNPSPQEHQKKPVFNRGQPVSIHPAGWKPVTT